MLTDRASMRRAFYRLMNTEADDPALHEHDPDGDRNEGLDLLLDHGLFDAQDWMIEQGLADRWVTTVDFPDWGTGADDDWQGADRTDGGRHATLPDDFFRLAGDEEVSALRRPKGDRWGRLIDWHDRDLVRGDHYWLQNENLWIASGASPPNDLQMDFHHRVELSDEAAVDFPKEDRPLIVAFAGKRAIEEGWPADEDGSLDKKVHRNLSFMKRRAWKRGRRSRQPRQVRTKRVVGSHWFY